MPDKGNWGSLEIGPTSSAIFDYATLRFGGWNAGQHGAILLNGGNAIINNSILTNNYIGLESNVVGSSNIHNSDIYGNLSYGIKNNQVGVWLNATNNWWGHISGPKDTSIADGISNPLGLGDQVSDYVNYSPWLPWSIFTKYVYLPLIRK